MPAALRRKRLHALLGLLAAGQITLRKVDGWHTLHVAPAKHALALVA
jgi:hypothetical protein